MTEPSKISPLLDGTRTHRFWWTWIPALPLSRDDKWYRVLETTFADHTTNWCKDGRWNGFYTEGGENHQTVSVFHTFTVLPTLRWLEQLLAMCGMPFSAPLLSARWQYELQSKYIGSNKQGHADIALRITDSRRAADEFVLVLEAKRKGGGLKKKDLLDPNHYTRLNVFSDFKAVSSVLLLDEADALPLRANPSLSIVTWQQIAHLQLSAFRQLGLERPTELLADLLLRKHLSHFALHPPQGAMDIDDTTVADAAAACSDERLAVWLQGAWTSIKARHGLEVQPPFPWLAEEPDIVDFTRLKRLNGRWFSPVW